MKPLSKKVSFSVLDSLAVFLVQKATVLAHLLRLYMTGAGVAQARAAATVSVPSFRPWRP